MDDESHVKTNKKYECERCDKYVDLKKKHVLNKHDNVKLYCHYYNNAVFAVGCPGDQAGTSPTCL